MGGIAGEGAVGLSIKGGDLHLNFLAGVPRADASITNNAQVNVLAAGGGSIAINAQTIEILNNSDLLAGIGADLGSFKVQGRDITLNATGAIEIVGSNILNTVQFNTSGIDLNRGLAALPANVIDTSGLIANSCIGRSNRREGKFIITGNGGLPVTPDDPMIAPYQTYQIPTVQSASISGRREQEGDGTPHTGIGDREALLQSADRSFSTNSSNSTPPNASPIVEATGWKYGAHGEVILVAQARNVAPRSSGRKLPTCKD